MAEKRYVTESPTAKTLWYAYEAGGQLVASVGVPNGEPDALRGLYLAGRVYEYRLVGFTTDPETETTRQERAETVARKTNERPEVATRPISDTVAPAADTPKRRHLRLVQDDETAPSAPPKTTLPAGALDPSGFYLLAVRQ